MKNATNFGIAAALAALAVGCTSYEPGSTENEKIVQRYEQNVVLDSDAKPAVAAKVAKHVAADVCTLGYAETKYAQIKDEYATMKRAEADAKAEEAEWQEFRRKHVGWTANQVVVEFGAPDAIEPDGANGKLYVYENSTVENENSVSMSFNVNGSKSDKSKTGRKLNRTTDKSSFSSSGSASSKSDSHGCVRIERIWFALDKSGKVYGVNRREATKSAR